MKLSMNILMVGCGKLGLPCAEVFAEHFRVVGYDINTIDSNVIDFEYDISKAVKDKDIIFIAVPTPHSEQYGGELPIAHLPPKDFCYIELTKTIKQVLKYSTEKQTVVVISTVLPGTMRKLAKICNYKNLIYNPYLIAMGSVKDDMKSPDCMIIGSNTGKQDKHIRRLVKVYNKIIINVPTINVGTWEEAEAIKIFYNTYISLKLCFVNMIQDVSQSLGNINVDVVVDALKSSKQRITSTRYMTPGLGDGGGCHPRDNIALRFLAKKLNLGYDMFQCIVESREIQAKNIASFICKVHKKTKLPIIIHGASYKPGVEYTNGSYSLLIDSYLRDMKCNSVFVDPYLQQTVCSDKPSIIFLSHPAVNRTDLYCGIAKKSIIIDPWRKYNRKDKNYTVIYYGNTRNS